MNVSCALGSHCVAVARPGGGIGPGFLLLVVLLIAAAGYGVTRLSRRRRAGRVADSAWRPEGQGPSSTGAVAPSGDRAARRMPPGRRHLSSRRRTSSARPSRRPGRSMLASSRRASSRPVGACRPGASRARRAARGAAVGLLGGPAGGWAVETHGLTKRFGPNVAVRNVELLVPRGSAFGYLGPNGAGKTTLIRTLLGLTKADAGSMSLLGIPVPTRRRQALARVGAIVDEPRFHNHLSRRTELAGPTARGAARTSGSRRLSRGSASTSGRRQGRLVLDGDAPAPGGGGVPAR